MWENSTNSLSVITSTVLLSLMVGASYTAITPDVIRSGDYDRYQVYSRAIYEDGSPTSQNYTGSISTITSGPLQKNIKKIAEISALGNNWNGNGARAFTEELLSKITSVVVALTRQPELFPTPANSIQFEYDGPNDSYLEIEIGASRIAEVYRINRDGSEEFFDVNVEANDINRLVAAFYG